MRTIGNTYCERFSTDEIPVAEHFAEHPYWHLANGCIQVTLPALPVTTGSAQRD